ncbi:ATP-binding protein [Streptomyces sp. NPDC005012]|uniref:sensor histidine kinase n=1 Tax=Streptomyces sp. NPDC005012 TaxID=3154558 RepID=UPI0033AF1090
MATRPPQHRSTSAVPAADPPAAGGRGAPPDRAPLRRATALGALPAASATLLAGAAYAAALSPLPTSAAVGAGICAAIGCAAVTATATVSARRAAASATAREQAAAAATQGLGELLESGLRQIEVAARRVRRGETPLPLELPDPPATGGARPPGAVTGLQEAVRRTLTDAHTAVLTAGAGRRTDASLAIVRKIQTLVLRAMELLDDAHDRTEDPELLDVLFRIDHLVTRTQRAVESVAVLDGRLPRAVRRPVPLSTVLRQAAAETEDYTRIQVAPPPAGYALAGPAAAEVIHLIAELAENGARFSPADTKVTVRTALAREGLVVEIDDQGPGLTGDQLEEMNQLVSLAREPDAEDGRTGLAVVARVAQRLRLAVRFQTNLYGGVQALVRLPASLLQRTEEDPAGHEQPEHRRVVPVADTLPLAQVRSDRPELRTVPAAGRAVRGRPARGVRTAGSSPAVSEPVSPVSPAAPVSPVSPADDALFGPYTGGAWRAADRPGGH